MKIVLTTQELLTVVRKSFPPEMIPSDYVLTGVVSKGYSNDEYEIVLEKEKEEGA